jgi:hypothetical protein
MVIISMMIISLGFLGNSVEGADPIAEFKFSPNKPIVDEEVVFDAEDSTGEDLEYEWDFGDGDEARGEKVTHKYDEVGRYTVLLVVTNSTGGMSYHSETIHVREDLGLWWIWIPFTVFFSCCWPVFITIGIAVCMIFGVIWSIRMYQAAKKHDKMDVAQPYLIGMLVTGIITWFMGWLLFILPLIPFYIIYRKYNKKMLELGIDITKKDVKKSKRNIEE